VDRRAAGGGLDLGTDLLRPSETTGTHAAWPCPGFDGPTLRTGSVTRLLRHKPSLPQGPQPFLQQSDGSSVLIVDGNIQGARATVSLEPWIGAKFEQ
jgi:hypothetical protein